MKLNDGQWAVSAGAGKYYSYTKRPTQREAVIVGLKEKAVGYQEKMDLIHSQLEKLGAIDPQDTHGYLA